MHFFDESFWIAISFIIFLYFAYKPIRKAIINSLDARIKDIQNKLVESEKLNKEASQLLEEARREVDKFSSRKKELLVDSQNSIEQMLDIKAKEFELMLQRKKKIAIQMINSEKTKASEKLLQEFTDSVTQLARQYLNETQNNATSDKELIKRFMK